MQCYYCQPIRRCPAVRPGEENGKGVYSIPTENVFWCILGLRNASGGYLLSCLQERFWQEVQARKEKRRLNSSQVDSEQVTIHCKACKRRLCWATDLRRRGSNYICVDEDFASSVDIRLIEKQKDFKHDVRLGKQLLLLCAYAVRWRFG